MLRPQLILLFVALLSGNLIAADGSFQIEVSVQPNPSRPVPVHTHVAVPDSMEDVKIVWLKADGADPVVGQLTTTGLGEDHAQGEKGLHFVLPKSNQRKSLKFTVTSADESWSGDQFAWVDEKGKYEDLKFGDRTVLRYMYEAPDDSSTERFQETMKVYHHLYDLEGTNQLTKGPGGKFQHHRGIFYGFNRISYTQDGEKRTADIWHCKKGESQVHHKFVETIAGPVFARQTLEINWNGTDGKTFAKELRQLSVYHVDGAQVVDVVSKLESKAEDLKLDGDPQHAGLQFRATQFVPDNTASKTFYVRPDGVAKPGAFRNWPGDKEHINLVWNAMSFEAFDQQYTIAYLDHPQNPKPARFSERDYGRFGSYFVATPTEDNPLVIRYRYWLEPGTMSVEDVSALSNDFVDGAEVAASN